MKAVRSLSLPFALLIAVSASACSQAPDASVNVSVIAPMSLANDRVILRGKDGAYAEIGADGTLSLDGNAVALSPEQRAISQRYFAHAMNISKEGVAIGKDGAAFAGKTVSTILSGLASGNPDSIGTKVEADAAVFEQRAQNMCDRLADLRTAQEELTASLPAFEPFAAIEASSVGDCRS
ncbi:hypothetical protein [Lysobacter sp. Hz 25]|jgi:hypothetical protein|uniref:hypothetical protein n=1 Tax=Lysobacter sp. Hz 25 TaxID=3383698 RepID=UPI0038D48B41